MRATIFALTLCAAVSGCVSGTKAGPDPCADSTDTSCAPCALDTDCGVGSICREGVCANLGGLNTAGESDGAGGDCVNTIDCSMAEMCNSSTGQCVILPPGWCRQDSDCDAATPACSAATSNVPGVCVECMVDADCDSGERCGQNGTCAGTQQQCPPNAAPNGTGGCTCNAGFHLDATTHTCESDAPTAGCVLHAHPVPSQAGACACDTGYEPATTGTACVPVNNNGGNNGGGTDPVEEEPTDECGPNTIPIFFVCFCMPGYMPDPTGGLGCVEDTGEGEEGGEEGGSGDVCIDNDWYGDGVCDTFCASPDPDCDEGGTDPGGDTGDVCQDNGWYNDAVCDTFCPSPDPDCGGSAGDDDVCADNGWYNDGVCDDFCANPDPDCNVSADDVCADNGWYNDGECDTFCPSPDPDCGGGGSGDICEDNGWYGDMVCDEMCTYADPDCDDVCVQNDWYGDGECDTFCAQADPDC